MKTRTFAALLAMLVAACVGSTDDPSQARDLRVIGINFEPPELMAPDCLALLGGVSDGGTGPMGGRDGGMSPTGGRDGGMGPMGFGDAGISPGFGAYLTPVTMRWLIIDPAGMGRSIEYEIRACANVNDLQCDNEGDFNVLETGTTTAGVLTSRQIPAIVSVDGGFLLEEVVSQDDYKGLGGIRVPIVLHLKAGTEELYAQKLMVYSCRLFPSMKANQTPHLRSFTVRGEPWPEDVVKTIAVDDGEIRIKADDISDLEEAYTVPSVSLTPVNLVESWKVSWVVATGKMSPTTSGGSNIVTNVAGPLESTWKPGSDAGEGDVGFYMIVRDGRGGESWVSRTAHLIPSATGGQ